MASTSTDWREAILADEYAMEFGGSGESKYHVPIDSMAALLGWFLVWHEDQISDDVWGERFYQWGVAAGISKPTLHTITFAMLNIARELPWVLDTEPADASAPVQDPAYSARKSKVDQTGMDKFLGSYLQSDTFPLMAVPGLGEITATDLSSNGERLGSGWEPPPPGEDADYKIPIESFACLMGHLLIFHQEDIDAPQWGERFFTWGEIVGIGRAQLHPIACALLEVASLIPCVADDTCDGLAGFSEGTVFQPGKSNTREDVLAEFIEWTGKGPINVLDVPSLGHATARILASSSISGSGGGGGGGGVGGGAAAAAAAAAALELDRRALELEEQRLKMEGKRLQLQKQRAQLTAAKDEQARRARAEAQKQQLRQRRPQAGGYKAQLTAFWTIYAPEKLGTEDAVLAKYCGREKEMMTRLKKKYTSDGGAKPRSNPSEKSCCEKCSIM